MTEQKTSAKPATVDPAQARDSARKQAEVSKFIQARIRAAKAKRMASRPRPRVEEKEE